MARNAVSLDCCLPGSKPSFGPAARGKRRLARNDAKWRGDRITSDTCQSAPMRSAKDRDDKAKDHDPGEPDNEDCAPKRRVQDHLPLARLAASDQPALFAGKRLAFLRRQRARAAAPVKLVIGERAALQPRLLGAERIGLGRASRRVVDAGCIGRAPLPRAIRFFARLTSHPARPQAGGGRSPPPRYW